MLAGVDPNARDSAGQTPLTRATSECLPDAIVDLLAREGADPSNQDNCGRSLEEYCGISKPRQCELAKLFAQFTESGPTLVPRGYGYYSREAIDERGARADDQAAKTSMSESESESDAELAAYFDSPDLHPIVGSISETIAKIAYGEVGAAGSLPVAVRSLEGFQRLSQQPLPFDNSAFREACALAEQRCRNSSAAAAPKKQQPFDTSSNTSSGGAAKSGKGGKANAAAGTARGAVGKNAGGKSSTSARSGSGAGKKSAAAISRRGAPPSAGGGRK